MQTPSLHDIIDSALAITSAISTVAIWLFRRARGAEAIRIEQIAKKESALIRGVFDAHEIKDDARERKSDDQFEQHAAETQELMSKIDGIEETRREDHAQNLERLEKLDDVPANLKILMDWFAEWRRSKF